MGTKRLGRGASGLRHLRWAREIYATLAAHVESSDLGAARKRALEKELQRLDGRIQNLSAAVKGYRDFLERERVRHRGAIRAAAFVEPGTTNVSPEIREARRVAAVEAMVSECLPKQRTLKAALEMAVAELRAHLLEMDMRVAGLISESFVNNLYPELAADDSRVADDGDDDDDAAARASVEDRRK